MKGFLRRCIHVCMMPVAIVICATCGLLMPLEWMLTGNVSACPRWADFWLDILTLEDA